MWIEWYSGYLDNMENEQPCFLLSQVSYDTSNPKCSGELSKSVIHSEVIIPQETVECWE